MEIVTFEKPTTASEFVSDVEQLIFAGDGMAGVIKVKSDEANDKTGKVTNRVANAKRGFQTAAREAGKTARLVKTELVGEETALTFILTDIIVRAKNTEDAPQSTSPSEGVDETVSQKVKR